MPVEVLTKALEAAGIELAVTDADGRSDGGAADRVGSGVTATIVNPAAAANPQFQGSRFVLTLGPTAVGALASPPFATDFDADLPVPTLDQGTGFGSIVDTVISVRELLRAMTQGPIRWRLGFPSGHRRATVWQVARDVAARAPELVNDPTDTTWDVLVDDAALELVPRRADDPRFAWRVAEVRGMGGPGDQRALDVTVTASGDLLVVGTDNGAAVGWQIAGSVL